MRYFNRAMVVACSIAFTAVSADAGLFKESPSNGDLMKRAAQQKDVPDIDSLNQITLARHPTKREVREYINKILLVSRNQKQYFASDPQVSMLMEVGHENIDELLMVTRGYLPWNAYLVEAIKNLAKPEDKVKIIAAIEQHPPLVEVVLVKGWARDAKPLLLQKLRTTTGYLPTDWIKAVAALQDRSTYDDLINYFINGWNRHVVYGIIKVLPGIDLKKALPLAWENARGNKYELADLTDPVLAMGYLPALDYCVNSLTGTPADSGSGMRALIVRYTGMSGSNEEIKAWYMKNRSKLRFDGISKQFVVKNKGRVCRLEPHGYSRV